MSGRHASRAYGIKMRVSRLDVWMTDGMVSAQSRQITMGESRQQSWSHLHLPQCAGGDAEQRKSPPPPSPEARSARATRPDIPGGLMGRRSPMTNQRRPTAAQPLPSRCSDTHLIAGLSSRKRVRTLRLPDGRSLGERWKERSPVALPISMPDESQEMAQYGKWRKQLVVAVSSGSRFVEEFSSLRPYRAISPFSWCCR